MSWGRFQPRRILLPAVIFVIVVGVHFVWVSVFPETDDAQEGWAVVATGQTASWVDHYVASGAYWMGYSYALPLAFAVAALRWYREERLRGAGKAAAGGVTLSGLLATLGCFLAGCCGSPMLGVYLSLFGASFLPWAKPLVAALTTLIILATFIWLKYRMRQHGRPCISKGCGTQAD